MKVPHVSAPPSRFAAFYNEPTFSDCLVVLRAALPGNSNHGVFPTLDGRGASGCDVGDQACACVPHIEEIRVHAHSVILASSSEMMRCWLTRWSEAEDHGHGCSSCGGEREQADCEDEHVESGRPPSRCPPARRQRRTALRLELELAPGELEAGEAVLRYMYTQALDGVDDDEQLLACMLLADRWLLPDCAASCAARLASTPAGSLHWRVRAALLALPPGLASACPAVAQLTARAEAALMRSFRCPELMWEDPDNRQLLLSLPAGRLSQLLLSRDDLQVSSENVVLSLLSEWLQHQHPESEQEPPTGARACDGGACAACGRGRAAAAAATATAAEGYGVQPEKQGIRTQAQDTAGAASASAPGGGGMRGDEDGGSGSGGTGGGGGGAAQLLCGPAEVEELLRHVRYCRLGAHFRERVAPTLPGLRRLRLHHELLAGANAVAEAEARLAAQAEAAALAAAAPLPLPLPLPQAPSAGAAAPQPRADRPEEEALAQSKSKAVATAAAAACPCAAADGASSPAADCGGGGGAAPSHGSSGCAPGLAAHGSSACAALVPTPPATPGALSRASSGCAGELTGAINACAAAATAGGIAGGGGAPVALEGQCGAGGAECGGAAVGAAALPAREAAAAAALTPVEPQAAPAPRPPPRQPYNVLRRIEWCRDVRDVRIHLTGVGGPMQGGEAQTSHHLSPPVFLGGYHWHVATRFVPASAAAAAPAAGASAANAPAAPPPGRLQLQLGVVCTAPAGAAAPRPAAATAAAAAAGRALSPSLSLSLSSCTLGVLDSSGRSAWQLAAAPCRLEPADDAGGAAGAAAARGASDTRGGAAAAGGGDGGGVSRWEYWSGLVGLEPTWWESGSAITSGGVVRLYCLLQLSR